MYAFSMNDTRDCPPSKHFRSQISDTPNKELNDLRKRLAHIAFHELTMLVPERAEKTYLLDNKSKQVPLAICL